MRIFFPSTRVLYVILAEWKLFCKDAFVCICSLLIICDGNYEVLIYVNIVDIDAHHIQGHNAKYYGKFVYIYRETKNNNNINDRHTVASNTTFDTMLRKDNDRALKVA
jgi:nitrate reductase NapAB chaperone NapD